VTLNRAIDLRRERRAASAPLEDAIPSADTRDRTEAKLDQEVLRSDVAEALDRLTEIQRSVLVAKVYDEMTFARIAVELGLAVPTVKTHYLRAVRTVRDRLVPRWGKED
jgi:RNA polymerase sigma factor (sigma-70 family)